MNSILKLFDGSNWFRWYWQANPLVEYHFEGTKIIDSKEFADSLRLDKWLEVPKSSLYEPFKIRLISFHVS